jgi:hypothetical protein
MSMIQKLDKLPLEGIKAKPPRALGKAKLVFLEFPNNMMHVSTPKLTQAWPIRASDDASDKFTLEVRLDSGNQDNEVFKNALNAFDMRVRKLAIENKKAWFGKAADDIESENDLRQMHTMSIKKGNEKPDGSFWDSTVKFKVTGWKDYVEEIMYKGEGDKKYPVDVKWRSRLVNSQGHGGPDDNQTKFYICENRDMTTGKEQMAPWTPCQDPAGNQIKDASGNTVWEFVGPKHCQPGCKLTIVFQPTMVWLASKFGVTLSAKQIFITPAPSKPKTSVEGIDIVDFVDPILASRAARQALASDDLRDLEAMPADNDSDNDTGVVTKATGGTTGVVDIDDATSALEAVSSDVVCGLKRSATLAASAAADSPASKTTKTKKSKTVKLDASGTSGGASGSAASGGPTVDEEF